jgi:hypothetical protein
MFRVFNATLLVCSFLLAASSAEAQVNLGTNPVIGGAQVDCDGAVTIVAPINDIGMALPGQIILNPILFNYYPFIQLFVYYHECAHQYVGRNEPAADCWAIRLGRDRGWLPPAFANMIAMQFINSPGDWTHAPGPWRVQMMANCYNTP